MTTVFVLLSITSLLAYLFNAMALMMGWLAPSYHMVVGIGAGLYLILVHCFIFALFTGSGKDIRLMSQDYPELGSDFLKQSRSFKKKVFPHALYAIFGVLILAVLGGAGSVWAHSWLGWVHRAWAFLLFAYLIYVACLEAKYVRKDILLIHELNRRLSSYLEERRIEKEVPESEFTLVQNALALSKFLKFLAWNVWLPFLYLRFIVGNLALSWVPFLIASVLIWLLSLYVQWAAREEDKACKGASV